MTSDRGPEITAVGFTLLTTSIITVGLRLYTHGFILKKLFAEDYISVVALLLLIAYTVFGFLSVQYGLGQHVVDVPPDNVPIAVMYRWLGQLMYILISCLSKWIIGLFLLRVCPRKRWRQLTIWILLGIVTVFTALYFFLNIWSCRPVPYSWTRFRPDPPEGECNASGFATVTIYVASFLNIIADWILPALPATLVWKAQMEMRVKLSIIFLLCLGSIASIATIIRIVFARGILDNPDHLYTWTNICIWSTVEIGVAITASSLATLKPLLRKAQLFKSSRNGGTDAPSESGPRLSELTFSKV